MERALYYFIYYGLPLIAGAGLGSFYSVLAYRLPRGQSIVFPASRCTTCTTPLRPWNNIPVLSFVLQRGKCSYCGSGISWRYPLLELGTALLVLLLARMPFPAVEGGGIVLHSMVIGLLTLTVPVTLIDAEFGLIPHIITVPGTVLAAGAAFLSGGITPLQMLGGAAAGAGALWAISKVTLLAVPPSRRVDGSTVGGGDIMLLLMYGALLGPVSVLTGLGAGAVLALLFVLLFRAGNRHKPFPFGPFLAAGLLVSAVWGEAFIRWYMGLI